MKDFKQLYNRILVINVVLFLGLASLFVLHFTSKTTCTKSSDDVVTNDTLMVVETPTEITGKVAVVNLDKLLLEYALSTDLNEVMMQKQKQAEAQVQTKMQKLEKDLKAFQEKMRLGSFLSQASAEAQQKDLMKQEQDLQIMQQNLSLKLAQEQDLMNRRLLDSVTMNMPAINNGRFDVVLGDAANATVLYKNSTLDITEEVLTFLNNRYQSSTSEEK